MAEYEVHVPGLFPIGICMANMEKLSEKWNYLIVSVHDLHTDSTYTSWVILYTYYLRQEPWPTFPSHWI